MRETKPQLLKATLGLSHPHPLQNLNLAEYAHSANYVHAFLEWGGVVKMMMLKFFLTNLNFVFVHRICTNELRASLWKCFGSFRNFIKSFLG